MKKLIKLSIALSILVFTSCNNKVEENIKMYTETWDEIINSGNLELINENNFTDDVTLIYSPDNIVGLESFKDYYSNFVTGFSDVEFTMKNVFGQDDNIVKHWHYKGTHTGDFFGIPATGKTVNIEGVTLVKMNAGKIAQEQDFMDNMLFLQQLGIISSPENIGIIDNLYKAFDVGDIPSVLGSLDANVIWNEAEGNAYADGNPYIGPDAVLNGVFARVGGEWDGFKLVDIELHDMSNNQVLATLRYNGTYKKTNKAIDAQVAHLWTLKDGKVIAFQQYVDTKQLNDVTKK
ncbi:ester cyclase [Thalassobellus suaedae]|uniref:Ester cyclase n=1 Tax=Thalassobellus suaedae TaxID=3074124 RepID=A0ABY9Y4B7_9FLAO|nr:ester cyclase [Flavobacteriaceae bacterium HL-DH10]